VPAEKIEVIYSGTDLERFHPGVDGAPIRRELSFGRDDLVVTQVGVRSWRGWKELLAAMRTVVARQPRARLLFVGAPPPRVAEIADRARAAGLGDRVTAIGHRGDVPAILCASDVVADASWAGLGITGSIREALACERRSWPPPWRACPSSCAPARRACSCARDPMALAEAILTLLGDLTSAQAMARAGRKRVEAHFSLRAKLDATEALYRRLVDARRAA